MTANHLALARREASCIDADLADAARYPRDRVLHLRHAMSRVSVLMHFIGAATDVADTSGTSDPLREASK